jgi:hypothetical protein
MEVDCYWKWLEMCPTLSKMIKLTNSNILLYIIYIKMEHPLKTMRRKWNI